LDTDDHGRADPLLPIAEAKDYRGEGAIEKRSSMNSYRAPDINHLGSYGHWAFPEFNRVIEGIAP